MTPLQEITNLTLTPGGLSFRARIAGGDQEVWLRGGDVTPPADAALAMCLIPAMVAGGRLRLEGEVSPRVLRMQPEFQAIQAAWSRDWPVGMPPLQEVEVEAAARAMPTPRRGRVAAFFSGGVDSWATVLSAPEVTDLIFVHGLDIVPSLAPQHRGLGDRVEGRLRETAEGLGKRLHVLETNVREMTEPLLDWFPVHAAVLAGIGLYFESLFERVLIPTDSQHAHPIFGGPSHMIDGLWSSEAVEIVDHGGRLGRFERTRLLAADPLARASLRVCFENPEGAYNCGRCRKCILTMITLEALGARSGFTTFPPDLDLSLLDGLAPMNRLQLSLWTDCLRGMKGCGRPDLIKAVATVVERNEGDPADPALLRAREEAERARTELRRLTASKSWRLTEPLRRLRSKVR